MSGLCPLLPVRRSPELSGHVPAALASVSHVFLRVDAVKRPLTPPYDGPFAVLERGQKTFKILGKAGKEIVVSIDRLKPAFSLGHGVSLPANLSVSPSSSTSVPSPVPRPALVPTSAPIMPFTSSSGRRVRPPDRLNI